MARLYKNMEIYQLGYNLALDIHKLLDKFPKKEKDNIISQMRRSVTSIPLNIAEGSVKKSDKELGKILTESEQKLGKLRFDKDKEIKNHREIRMLHRQIARIKTLLKEKK